MFAPEAHKTKKEEIPGYAVRSALEKGATDVAAELVDQRRVMIRFSNNEITISKVYRETLLSIFLMIEKRRASTSLSPSPAGSIERAVGDLVKRAKNTPPMEVYAPLPQGPFQYDPRLLKGSGITFSLAKLTGYVQEAIDSALKEGAKKVAGTLTATKTKRTLATSGQVQAAQEKNGLEMSVRAFTSDVASGHSVSISTNERDFKPAEAGRMAGETAVAAANPRQGKPGRFTALLGPLVFADLASQVGSVSSAFQVDIGRSFLVDRIGCSVASDKFTLTDDPTVPDSFGVKAFDDEGAPTRRNVIIDKGVLKTFLHNSITAKKFGVETTGNAGLVSPHPWNMMIEPGQKSFEELLAETDQGIYVTNDWYLRYQNYRKGDFSTIPRDGMFLIRKGEVSISVRDLRISDSMPRILQSILELSRSRSWIKWWEVPIPILTPCALIEDLNFTKSRT